MSDCLWGLLDGLNHAGLAASLTFGGRRAVGDGFWIPLVIRYLLETCETVAEAQAVLARVPVHAAQNVTLLDRTGAVVTACLSPDREPDFSEVPAAPTISARTTGRSTPGRYAPSSASAMSSSCFARPR